jgi:pimeloyl-ACP methyl ester carboxylesterase
MSTTADPLETAVDAPNRFVDSNGRRLAYRSIGSGTPLLLCTRFRGTLDYWDPAFLDALTAHGFRVITFDYSGLGASTGTPDYGPPALAQDACDLADALGLERFVLGGWSLGGLAAQVFLARWPQRLTHLVLIGSGPPGDLVKAPEQLFYDTASIEVNSLEDEVILFFEPLSVASQEAASASHHRIAARAGAPGVPVPIAFARAALGNRPRNPIFPAPQVLEVLKLTEVPVLHIGGDHDVSFPVENWYALNNALPTLQLLTFPRTGHGPHHQHPQASADAIRGFVANT